MPVFITDRTECYGKDTEKLRPCPLRCEIAYHFVVETTEFETKSIYSWDEVSRVHRIRNGIYQRNGRLISLLTDFGRINPCYPDFHGDTTDVIHYTGYGRRGDQKLDASNRALLDAVESSVSVPLFNKLAPGRWEYLGKWQVAAGVYIFDENAGRMIWKFTLNKVDD